MVHDSDSKESETEAGSVKFGLCFFYYTLKKRPPSLDILSRHVSSQLSSCCSTFSLPMKRQRTAASPENEIYFKAFRKSPYQRLSNLFGSTEWRFQLTKFCPTSEVARFMNANAARAWTFAEFEAILKELKHDGKASSYLASNGQVASGLIPKLLSIIAKPDGESVDLARKRLAVILKTPVSAKFLSDWRRQNVRPEISDAEKDALLHTLLMDKFKQTPYKELLLSTGDAQLHEAKGRGPPNRYEWQQKPLTEEDIAKGYTRGGDALGKLMMVVRTHISSI